MPVFAILGYKKIKRFLHGATLTVAIAGIWYEALATLAQMRRQTTGDARSMVKRTQLLQSQGLESVAGKSLVGSLLSSLFFELLLLFLWRCEKSKLKPIAAGVKTSG